MNINNRLILLDYVRVVFAFLVVVIHVPLVGKGVLTPIACCAVPFFYMVTGFFLYDKDPMKIRIRIVKALNNYAKIWIVAFSLSITIVTFLKVAYSNSLSWSSRDFIDLFLIYGNCKAAELVTIDEISYGTSSLWFLYGGIISLALFLCFRKLLFKKTFFLVVLALYYISIIINYKNGYVVPRILSASFIFLYAGLLYNKIRNENSLHERSQHILLIYTILLIIGLYMEQLLFHCESYNRFLLLPTSLAIFILITNWRIEGGGNVCFL